MREVNRTALVPYAPEQIFALVADVERYPAFLPWCVAATVLKQDATETIARLELVRSGVRAHFTTRNVLMPPERMDLRLIEGPFKLLEGTWTFQPVGPAGTDTGPRGTRIGLHVRFELANPVTGLLLSRVFERTCDSLVDAFVQRARDVHGSR